MLGAYSPLLDALLHVFFLDFEPGGEELDE